MILTVFLGREFQCHLRSLSYNAWLTWSAHLHSTGATTRRQWIYSSHRKYWTRSEKQMPVQFALLQDTLTQCCLWRWCTAYKLPKQLIDFVVCSNQSEEICSWAQCAVTVTWAVYFLQFIPHDVTALHCNKWTQQRRTVCISLSNCKLISCLYAAIFVLPPTLIFVVR